MLDMFKYFMQCSSLVSSIVYTAVCNTHWPIFVIHAGNVSYN